jgi:hypothetical protein
MFGENIHENHNIGPRYIESDEKLSLRGDKLKEAIAFDKENGYIPFFVSQPESADLKLSLEINIYIHILGAKLNL